MKRINTYLTLLLLCGAMAVQAEEKLPATAAEWERQRNDWFDHLRTHTFSHWPKKTAALQAEHTLDVHRDDIGLRAIHFTGEAGVRLPLYIAQRSGLENPDLVVLTVLDEKGRQDFLSTMRPGFEKDLDVETWPAADEKAYQQTRDMFRSFKWVMAYIAPRCVVPAQDKDGARQDDRQVLDIRRAIQALRTAGGHAGTPLWLQAEGDMASAALLASLFEPDVTRMDLYNLPHSLRGGPFRWEIETTFDMPQVVAMAVERTGVVVYEEKKQDWSYPVKAAEKYGWKTSLRIRKPPAAE
ncbi:MAG: hypothetical protein AAF492_00490 [Verrucomicrobiota bacterium]